MDAVSLNPRGLPELKRDLNAADGDLPGAIRRPGEDMARKIAAKARGDAAGLGGVAAHVAPSIEATTNPMGGSAGFGGGSYPMAEGAEFGGQGRPTTQQFKPWRGSGSGAGYFFYPAVRSEVDHIEEVFEKAVSDMLERHDL